MGSRWILEGRRSDPPLDRPLPTDTVTRINIKSGNPAILSSIHATKPPRPVPERSILRLFVQKRPSPKKRARREAVCFHKPFERFLGSPLGTPPCTVCFELSRYRNIRWHGSRDTYASCRPKISGGRGGAGCQLELSFRQMEITGSLLPFGVASRLQPAPRAPLA